EWTALFIRLANHGIAVGRLRAGLEGFEDHALVARLGAEARLGIDADQLDAGRHAERLRRLIGERGLEKIADDRSRVLAAGDTAAERARPIVTEIDAD